MDGFGGHFSYYEQDRYFPQTNGAHHQNAATYEPNMLALTQAHDPNGINDSALPFLVESVTGSIPSLGYEPPSSVVSNCIGGFGNSSDIHEQHMNLMYQYNQNLHDAATAASSTLKKDEDYTEFKIKISGLSLEPMTAAQIVDTVRKSCDDVITRYLPCVDFLVQCQQELRTGLAYATRKRAHRGHSHFRDNMSPRQFYVRYIEPLPTRFHEKNRRLMSFEHLKNATKEISNLCMDARKNEHLGCEMIKNTFLGGMRDGESWGLRRWLSKNGGALKSCNDLELIFQALQKLDRESDTTRRLADKVRPLSDAAHKRLKNEIPSAYQEISSAHPYLPFFHRLESALSGLANFDPDDDDVVIIDDEEEIEKVKSKSEVPLKSTPLFNMNANQPQNDTKNDDKDKIRLGLGLAFGVGFGSESVTADIKETKNSNGKIIDNCNINGRKRADIGDSEDSYDSSSKKRKLDDSGSAIDEDQDSFIAKNASILDSEVDEWMAGTATQLMNGSIHNYQDASSGNNNDDDNNREAGGEEDEDSDCEVVCVMVKPSNGNHNTDTEFTNNNSNTNTNISTATAAAAASITTTNTNTNGNTKNGQWRCAQCTYLNASDNDRCIMCDSDDEQDINNAVNSNNTDPLFDQLLGNETSYLRNVANTHQPQHQHDSAASSANEEDSSVARDLANQLDTLAQSHEQGRVTQNTNTRVNMSAFWNQDLNYAYILRLLASLIRSPQASIFLEPINEEELTANGLPEYRSIIKNPLSFRCISNAVVGHNATIPGTRHHNGRRNKRHQLANTGLSWNMRCGIDLLQAIDLVFLNCLAYNGKDKTQLRMETMRLRKILWDGIYQRVGSNDRINIPTKRGENSGFVVFKKWR